MDNHSVSLTVQWAREETAAMRLIFLSDEHLWQFIPGQVAILAKGGVGDTVSGKGPLGKEFPIDSYVGRPLIFSSATTCRLYALTSPGIQVECTRCHGNNL